MKLHTLDFIVFHENIKQFELQTWEPQECKQNQNNDGQIHRP